MTSNRPIILHPRLYLAAPLAILLSGCAQEKELEEICEWVVNPEECQEDGAGETGGGVEDDEPTDSPACVVTADGQTRTVYQCAGSFSASLAFNTLLGDCGQTLGDPGWCDEVHEFGPLADPYEMPAVMACCDAGEPVGDELVKHCGADMVEQICRSVPTRLQNLIDEGAFPVGENQAQKLQGWLAEHQQDCYDKLYKLTEVPGELASVAWLVNGGNNGKWPSLDNFTIKIDSAKVDYAYLPENEDDHLSCTDNDLNNTEIFEDSSPPSPGINSITYLGQSPLVWITGPEFFGGPVSSRPRRAAASPRGARCWRSPRTHPRAAGPSKSSSCSATARPS